MHPATATVMLFFVIVFLVAFVLLFALYGNEKKENEVLKKIYKEMFRQLSYNELIKIKVPSLREDVTDLERELRIYRQELLDEKK